MTEQGRRPWSHHAPYVVGIAVGVLYSIVRFLMGRPLWLAILGGVLFAAVWTSLFFILARRRERRAREQLGSTAATTGVHSHGEATVPASAPEVREQVTAAVSLIPRARVIDSGETWIEVRVGVSRVSWGERIRVDLEPAGDQTRVQVSSEPRVPITLFDHGKNQHNVTRLIDAVRGQGATPA